MALKRRLDTSLYTAAAGPPFDGEAASVASADYTPSDGQPFSHIWVSVTGNLAYTTMGGTAIIVPAVPVGLFSQPGLSVQHTGTTATITHGYVR